MITSKKGGKLNATPSSGRKKVLSFFMSIKESIFPFKENKIKENKIWWSEENKKQKKKQRVIY